jgi:MFS family permease
MDAPASPLDGLRLGPRFARYFAARTISVLGDSVAPVALAFAVLEVPGLGAGALGGVLAARSAAQVALMLLGGVLADRVGRARLMAIADVAAFASQAGVAALVLTRPAGATASHTWLASLVALGAVSGGASALFFPAATGLVPELVPTSLLQRANSLLRLSLNSTRIAGAAAAGLLVAAVGSGWAIGLDALTFVASAALVAGLRAPRPAAAAAATEAATTTEAAGILTELRQGWREFASRQWVWVIVLQFSILNACFSSGFAVLGPVVARDRMGGAIAWSLIAGAEACGLALGSLLALKFRPRRPMRAAVVASLGFSLPLWALASGAPAWVAAVGAFAGGVCIDIFGVLWETGLQRNIPAAVISRVSAYDLLGSFVLIPIAQAAVGVLAARIGTAQALGLEAATIVLVAAAALALSPEVRHMQWQAPETETRLAPH